MNANHIFLRICGCHRRIIRFYSSHPQDHVKPPSKVRRYFIDKFVHYVEGYEKLLGSKYPKIYGVYKTIKEGIPGLLSDTRTYSAVTFDLWQGKGLHHFSRKQLEVYRQMPREMLKATPLLILSAVPFGGTLFPVAYLYPRQLLTTHFWTPEQKVKFSCFYLRHRLQHMPGILSGLKSHLKHIEDPSLRSKMKNIITKLQVFSHPTVEELLEVKPLFEHQPYSIEKLSIPQVRHLAKSLGLPLRKSKLLQDGLILLHTDLAMVREGMSSMTDSEMEQACFARGLNPVGLSRTARTSYLKQWTDISQEVDENSISLLLHSPVLLAYNHPTNKSLMSEKKS